MRHVRTCLTIKIQHNDKHCIRREQNVVIPLTIGHPRPTRDGFPIPPGYLLEILSLRRSQTWTDLTEEQGSFDRSAVKLGQLVQLHPTEIGNRSLIGGNQCSIQQFDQVINNRQLAFPYLIIHCERPLATG